MISKTKYKIENKEIEKIFRAAGIGGITGISPLGAGEYNAVFSVSTREKEYVLKMRAGAGGSGHDLRKRYDAR